MSMTRSLKSVFARWFISILKANKTTIETSNPNITFDVTGHVTELETKETAFVDEEGKVSALVQAKVDMVKSVNDKLDDFYVASSASAESVIGHLGKDHTLSKIISKQRDSMVNIKLRGKKNPPKSDNNSDTTTEPTPET